MWTFKNIHM